MVVKKQMVVCKKLKNGAKKENPPIFHFFQPDHLLFKKGKIAIIYL